MRGERACHAQHDDSFFGSASVRPLLSFWLRDVGGARTTLGGGEVALQQGQQGSKTASSSNTIDALRSRNQQLIRTAEPSFSEHPNEMKCALTLHSPPRVPAASS